MILHKVLIEVQSFTSDIGKFRIQKKFENISKNQLSLVCKELISIVYLINSTIRTEKSNTIASEVQFARFLEIFERELEKIKTFERYA